MTFLDITSIWPHHKEEAKKGTSFEERDHRWPLLRRPWQAQKSA